MQDQNRIVFFVASLLVALPVLLPEYPPMVDVPQHAAQISMFLELVGERASYEDLYSINWFTPYWLGYSIVILLSGVVGVLWAMKIVIALALVLFPFSASRFLVLHGGSPVWGWFFIPVAYGFAYQWGFLNFLIGVSVGFLFLSEIRPNRTSYGKREIISIVLWVHFLFLCHVLIMAFFVGVAGIMLFDKKLKVWFSKLIPYFSVVPVVLVWVGVTLSSSSQFRGDGPWGWGMHRVISFLPEMVGLPAVWMYQVVAVFVCILPFLLGLRIHRKFERVMPFLVYVIVMLLGPNFLFGNFFTYNRFGMVGLPFYFFMFHAEDASPQKRRFLNSPVICFLCATYAAIFVFFQTQKSLAFGREAAGFSEVLKSMESDRKVLSLVFERYSAFYDAPVYLHFPVWYQVEKAGLVDFSFAYFYPQVVRYKKDSLPLADPTFVWYPQLFRYDVFVNQGYDYYLVKAHEDLTTLLFPAGTVSLVNSAGGWWLYEKSAN